MLAPDTIKLAESHGVRTPPVPGGVFLTGTLPKESVAEISTLCKSWLFLNPETDVNLHREEIEAGGAKLQVIAFMPTHFDLPGRVDEVIDAVRTLPRPLLIQCNSAVRASLAVLLWLARERGYTGACAELLAQDLQLDILKKPEIVVWMKTYLPQLNPGDGKVDPLATLAISPEVRQLFDPQSSTLTYLVVCPDTNEGVLVDPVMGQKARDMAIIQELGVKLKYVINTHCHADHVTSAGVIQKEWSDVRTVISDASGAKADIRLKHGDRVNVGNLNLDARATPGHTDGCMSFVLEGRASRLVFTGDALLVRGCGRTDFQQGCAGRLYDSVHSQIFTLPSDTIVCPAHDYKGRSVSTVQEELHFNSRLTKTRDQFHDIMKNLDLPYPAEMDVAVPANMLCGIQD